MKQKLQFFMTAIATVLFGSMSMAQCAPGEGELTVDVTTDGWGYEVYWEMTPVGDACGTNTMFTYGNAAVVGCAGGGLQVALPGIDVNEYADNATATEVVGCFDLSACFDVHLIDDWNDGGTTFDFKIDGVTLYSFTTTGPTEVFTVCMSITAFDVVVDSVGIGSYYSIVPLVQAAPLSFEATMLNDGTSDVTNAMVTATVNDGTADVATATSTAVPTLVSGISSTGALTPGYTAVGMGTHTITFVSSMTEVDERTGNDTMVMMITYNDSVLARDNGIINGALGIGASSGDNGKLGQIYSTPVTDVMTSITGVINSPTPGDTTRLAVWDMTGATPNAEVATTAIYVMTAADSINAPLVLTLSLTTPFTMAANTDFLVLAHEYNNTLTLATSSANYEMGSNLVFWDANGWAIAESLSPSFATNYVLRPNFASLATIGENALNTASVYPNPTKGNVTVSLSEAVNNATVTVYSVSGAVVSSQVVSGTQFNISLDGLNNGLYIMELSNGSDKGVYRIVKD